ncbi:MAG: 50S ribosomal protein L13 [Candidatus Omnitrophota bacterium]|jgi:large subunit ribosomal protein L13
MVTNPKWQEKWFIVDADGVVLGRLAVAVSRVLSGKHKPTYRKDLNVGDGVVVINAAKIRVTGKKLLAKEYDWYSGYPGGRRTENLEDLLKRKPEYVITHAIKGMLAKNKVGKNALGKLRVFAGKEHDLSAQKPETLKV